ncbi:MAG: DUF4906 domain-containing protein [Alistipes sp.]|jgi:hypothetical protein|uniref:DUF4906 domain-containing protein n=1 Tax=uncultured Alistipes sp. TaxID=538949 RepID=UPI002596913D|nr:DUF4906 domain-containing protein [uncultured Alistipes sp.]MCI9244180.1 DUF4906 domain-containing protein [Alistipes sp.]
MKKIVWFIIPLLAMMSSCNKDEMEDRPSLQDEVRFSLQIQEEGVQYVTRATDEQTVHDVNLFLFDPRGVLPDRHFYVESGTVECSVLPGSYEAYAVANVHRDMGAMTQEQLRAVHLPSVTKYVMLPMSGHTTLTVEDRMSAPVITVRRTVAKIVCNISIDPAVVYALKLQSVQIMNAAATTKLFEAEQAADKFVTMTSTEIGVSEGRKATRTFYLLENCQGDVPSITTQQQKCAANAPQGATYVRIKAQKDGLQMTYDVYLGENNTSNFDVRRNSVQTLDIRIKGDNEVDARIHSFEVKISDDLPDADFGRKADRCIYDTGKRLSISVTNREKAGTLTAKIRLVQGQVGAFSANRQMVASAVTVSLDDPSGLYEIPIGYVARPVYTAANSRLVYEVTVSNTDGYSYTKTFTRDFYNLLTVYTYWQGRDNTAGRLEGVTAVSEIKTWTPSAFYTRLLSLDDGPTMPVVPNDGFAFKGWYADSGLTRKVSEANPYQHPMTSYRDTLYTEFVKEWVYIYTKLNEVVLVSDIPYRIDEAKQAFIVSPGSRCSISGKIGRIVTTWWDNPESSLVRRIVSTDNPYSFTATANRTLIPGYDAISKEEITSSRVEHSTD